MHCIAATSLYRNFNEAVTVSASLNCGYGVDFDLMQQVRYAPATAACRRSIEGSAIIFYPFLTLIGLCCMFQHAGSAWLLHCWISASSRDKPSFNPALFGVAILLPFINPARQIFHYSCLRFDFVFSFSKVTASFSFKQITLTRLYAPFTYFPLFESWPPSGFVTETFTVCNKYIACWATFQIPIRQSTSMAGRVPSGTG